MQSYTAGTQIPKWPKFYDCFTFFISIRLEHPVVSWRFIQQLWRRQRQQLRQPLQPPVTLSAYPPPPLVDYPAVIRTTSTLLWPRPASKRSRPT